MSKTVKRPGYMLRAIAAWFIFNGILVATLAATTYFLDQEIVRTWYVGGALALGIVVSEWIIMAETIAPVIKEWIKQEEWISDGKRPSWERE